MQVLQIVKSSNDDTKKEQPDTTAVHDVESLEAETLPSGVCNEITVTSQDENGSGTNR